MTGTGPGGAPEGRAPGPAAGAARWAAAATRRSVAAAHRQGVRVLGGPERARAIAVLAAVGGLASADAATVGASAAQLRHALDISNTDIGLLVTLSATVGAVAAVPFGVLADAVNRTRLLAASIVLWGVAMVWSATVTSFGHLLWARLALGLVTASAGPAVASLVGDYFPADERGRIYGFISLGELVGAGVGFVVTGDIAALSWRAAFVVLALPAFALAWLVLHLHEPRRGGGDLLPRSAPEPSPATGAGVGVPDAGTAGRDQATAPGTTATWAGAGPTGAGTRSGAGARAHTTADAQQGPQDTGAQRLAAARGIRPDPALAATDATHLGLLGATRYVFRVRTNVLLIVSGACAYYFFAGMQTFGLEFVEGQFHVNVALANLLMLAIGGGAIAGVLIGGRLGDHLLERGRLNGRILVAAVAGAATAVLFVPALTSRSILTALPYVVVAAAALSAQNPPIDAARLDIMPFQLWGRAEGIRTFVRTAAQALAPVVFGGISDLLGGGHEGLRWTFAIMLVPLGASAVLLFRALRTYPTDVATAAAVGHR